MQYIYYVLFSHSEDADFYWDPLTPAFFATKESAQEFMDGWTEENKEWPNCEGIHGPYRLDITNLP